MHDLLFVHGTGTRQAQYEMTCRIIAEKLTEFELPLRLVGCPWGDEVGVKQLSGFKSIPGPVTYRGSSVSVGQDELVVWQLLESDPLYEIRLVLALSPQSVRPLGQVSPLSGIDTKLQSISSEGLLGKLLEKAGVADILETAKQTLVQNAVYSDFISTGSTEPLIASPIIARGLTAQMCNLSIETDKYERISIDPELREGIVAEFASRLGGTARGFGDNIRNCLIGVATYALGGYDPKRRQALAMGCYPFPSDIILYQTRGDAIIQYINMCIDRCDNDVILLSHSLGGIASVDLLASTSIPKVKSLVTVGSQAAFLYEIDSLRSLRLGDSLPMNFPTWLNFYDRKDLLSFVAGPVFGNKVTDIEVDNRVLFPSSHIAYWTNKELWKELKAKL